MNKMISVIIPMHNNKETIRECLNSVLAQTYANLEIILIDDFSTDETVKEALSIIQNEKRARLIRYEQHVSAFVARKRGIQEAAGDYILFIDADDYISKGLCTELIQQMESGECDILHFNMQVVNCGVSQKTVEAMKKFAAPFEGRLFGEDIFSFCFMTEKYGFNLWNKMFSTGICKNAIRKLEDRKIPKANDLVLYFFLALEAEKYTGFCGEETYFYCYGKGSTGKGKITMKDFQWYCSYSDTVKYIEKVCENNYRENIAVHSAIEKIKKRLLLESVSVWHENIDDSKQGAAFNLMCGSWGGAELGNALWYLFNGKETDIAEKIRKSEAMGKIDRQNPGRLAIYYHRMCRGGVERVISLLIPLYLTLGYQVILITDEEPSEEDFSIPDGIRRYVIPSSASVQRKEVEYIERGKRLQEILLEEKTDIFCYQAATSPILFYDLVVAKLNHVEFIVTKHELFSQGMVRMLNRMRYENAVYPLVDKMTVLSESEKLYWQTMGVDAYYIPNPKPDLKLEREAEKTKKYIVWVGRLDKYQKRHQDIVPIVSLVAEKIPDIKVKIFGSAETYEDIYRLKGDIERHGLEKNIEYCGYTTDLQEIYGGAAIHLVTSAYESFPMGIFESHALGIPLVTYEMPYLELLKEDKGSLCVEPQNYRKMAEALVLLMENPRLREEMGREAKKRTLGYQNSEVGKEWKRLFSQRSPRQYSDNPYANEYRTILQTIAYHYDLGWKEADFCRKKMNRLQKEKWVNEIKLKLQELHAEVVLYPFGDIGRKTRNLLNQYGIKEAFIVDNKLSKTDEDILSVDDLKKIDCTKYLFAICSDKLSIYKEIRNPLKDIVPEANIYDLFPGIQQEEEFL